MPDIAEGRSAVREATRRAEEAAGIFRDDQGNEVYENPATTPEALPELQGAVPVQASDQPLPVEPATAATPTEPVEPVVPAVPAAPQTVEELTAERERLLAQVEEQKAMIGRQSTEVGQTREQMARIEAEIAAMKQQPVAATAPTMVITQELINEDPARATQLAFEQKNEAALTAAFEAWRDEDEFAAANWRTDRLLERKEQEFQARLDAVRAEVAQVAAPIASNAERQQWNDAFLQMQQKHPEFLSPSDDGSGRTNAERLLEDVAPQFPAVAEMIASGDVAAKVQGLTLLYGTGRLGNPAQVAAELQEAADTAAAQAAATRAAAATVNGQSTAGQGSTVELTEEEAEIERYKARLSGGVSLERGWTGRK